MERIGVGKLARERMPRKSMVNEAMKTDIPMGGLHEDISGYEWGKNGEQKQNIKEISESR